MKVVTLTITLGFTKNLRSDLDLKEIIKNIETAINTAESDNKIAPVYSDTRMESLDIHNEILG